MQDRFPIIKYHSVCDLASRNTGAWGGWGNSAWGLGNPWVPPSN